MSCDSMEANMKDCTCTYPGCPRKGKCCECVLYHRKRNQLPGCFFPKQAEAAYNRSYACFCEVVSTGGGGR